MLGLYSKTSLKFTLKKFQGEKYLNTEVNCPQYDAELWHILNPTLTNPKHLESRIQPFCTMPLCSRMRL